MEERINLVAITEWSLRRQLAQRNTDLEGGLSILRKLAVLEEEAGGLHV
jgi:hypothetical protein